MAAEPLRHGWASSAEGVDRVSAGMSQNTRFNPFELCDDWVVDDDHVRVERAIISKSTGRSVRFIKAFKKSPQFDYSWFNTHEAELLLRFKLQRLTRVAQIVDLEWNDDNSFDRVETLDAGPSLDHWLRLTSGSGAVGPAAHPLASPTALLLVLRSTLLALQEVHLAGHVHCDVDDRNICLPFAPHPEVAGAHAPVWHGLKLIDFAFSISPDHPLRVPLPIQPDPQLHSPAFMQALEEDFRIGTSRHVQRLDGRIDLFALGSMADRMLSSLRPLWMVGAASERGEAVVRQLIGKLKAEDATTSPPFDPGIYRRLLDPLDAELGDAGARFMPAFRLVDAGAGDGRVGQNRSGHSGTVPRSVLRPSPGQVAATPLAPPRPPRPVASTPLAPSPTPVKSGPPARRQGVPPVAGVPDASYPAPTPFVAGPTAPGASLPVPSHWTPTTAGHPTLALAPRRGRWSAVWERFTDSLRLERYRRAAERGDAEASFQIGRVLLRGMAVRPDAVAAQAWLLSAAQKGHAAAQATLGSCFDVGLGTTQDDAQAMRWYQAAAAQGHMAGHYGVGVMLSRGRGHSRDDGAAVTHFREAAAGGMPEAYDALGQMVLAGRGVVRHRADAIECFQRAAQLGYGPSADMLGRLHEQPEPGQLPDLNSARRWYRKAVSLGYEPAKSHLQTLQQKFPT